MYRIRLTSGEEAVFRSVEELALAVRSGVVSPKAEVFHKAANRWLPVEVHPDYQAAVSGKHPALPLDPKKATSAKRPAITARRPALAPIPGSSQAAPPPDPLRPVLRPPPPAPPAAVPAPRAASPPPARVTAIPAAPGSGRSSPSQRGRTLLAWTTAAGAVCLFGVGAFLAAPRLREWGSAAIPRTEALEEGMAALPAVQAQEMDPWPPSGAAPGPDSELVAQPDSESPAPAPSRAETDPGTLVSSLRASRTSGVSYNEAYAEARAELDESLRSVQFRRVFSAARFSSADSIRAARRMIGAAGNILRAYRGREVMLEQTYRPDDPGGRGTLREPFETAETSRTLLADADSLYGLLAAQQGRFKFNGTSLRFADPRAARQYSDLRRRIILTLGDWRTAPDLNSGVTIPRLILALGAEVPPPAR